LPKHPSTAEANGRYRGPAIILHWMIAGLILANIGVGLRTQAIKGLAQFELYQLHKSIGILVLVLSLARLAWRLASPPPPHPASMKAWEKAGASAAHWGFYLIMIGLPVTGWIMVSASPYNLPTILFKTVPWPHLGFIHDLPMLQRKAVEASTTRVHELLTYLTYALLALHLGAVAKHHLIDRHNALGRMWPAIGRKTDI